MTGNFFLLMIGVVTVISGVVTLGIVMGKPWSKG